jgi:hypothetical protein
MGMMAVLGGQGGQLGLQQHGVEGMGRAAWTASHR